MKTAILAVALALAACSGTRSYVVASASKYPISLSDGLRGPDGALLRPEQKHVVGEFSYNYKTWGMFWTMIAFTGDKDISAEINQQVKDAGGDGVTNLTVWAGACTWNVFTVVGVLPDCGNVEITGEIVKVSGTSTIANR